MPGCIRFFCCVNGTIVVLMGQPPLTWVKFLAHSSCASISSVTTLVYQPRSPCSPWSPSRLSWWKWALWHRKHHHHHLAPGGPFTLLCFDRLRSPFLGAIASIASLFQVCGVIHYFLLWSQHIWGLITIFVKKQNKKNSKSWQQQA